MNIKCPIHGKEFDTIYSENDTKLVKFQCGCVLDKRCNWVRKDENL